MLKKSKFKEKKKYYFRSLSLLFPKNDYAY